MSRKESSHLTRDKVLDIFFKHPHTNENNVSSTPTNNIISKLERLNPITVFDTIYVGTQEINDYYIEKTYEEAVTRRKAIYKMFRMWFVISGNEIFTLNTNHYVRTHLNKYTITGYDYTLNFGDIMHTTLYPHDISEVFVTTCAKNDVPMIRWLCDIMKFFRLPDQSHPYLSKAFRQVCERGHVEMARWLMEEFPHYEFLQTTESIDEIIRNGHFILLRWLIESYPNSDLWKGNKLFIYALIYEKFHIMKYLWSLNPSPSTNSLIVYFQFIINTGNLQILRWLWKRMEVVDACSIIPNQLIHLIKRAQRRGYFHISDWLCRQVV